MPNRTSEEKINRARQLRAEGHTIKETQQILKREFGTELNVRLFKDIAAGTPIPTARTPRANPRPTVPRAAPTDTSDEKGMANLALELNNGMDELNLLKSVQWIINSKIDATSIDDDPWESRTSSNSKYVLFGVVVPMDVDDQSIVTLFSTLGRKYNHPTVLRLKTHKYNIIALESKTEDFHIDFDWFQETLRDDNAARPRRNTTTVATASKRR
jgi:hypothetical protein